MWSWEKDNNISGEMKMKWVGASRPPAGPEATGVYALHDEIENGER